MQAGKALPEEVAECQGCPDRGRCEERSRPGRPASAPPSSPSSPATAPPVSRPPPASGCWAACANFATAVRHQALPLQLHQLGHDALPGGKPRSLSALGDYIFVPGIREAFWRTTGQHSPLMPSKRTARVTESPVSTGALTEAERQIIADGCLINYYRTTSKMERHGLALLSTKQYTEKRPKKGRNMLWMKKICKNSPDPLPRRAT